MKTLDLGEAVGPGVPTGGTANQLLVKNGSTNFDTSWKDAGTIPSIANTQDGLAIVANGNTHAAIAKDQAVYVRNHSTLAEGLYWASSAIGTNAALSTSNLTADSQGGLNKLKGDIDSLNSKTAISVTPGTNVVIDTNKSYLHGDSVFLCVKGHTTSEISNSKLFDFTTPTNSVLQTGSVFPISVGAQWDIDGVGYGYINNNSISGRVAAGKYFEVFLTLLLDR